MKVREEGFIILDLGEEWYELTVTFCLRGLGNKGGIQIKRTQRTIS